MKQLLTEEKSLWIEDMPVKADTITQKNEYLWSANIDHSSAYYNHLSVISTYSSGERGFTLIELLTVVLVAAVILVFAVPAFEGVINNNRVVSAANELTTSLARARMAAIKTNTQAEIKSTSGGTDWTQGYVVKASLYGSSTTVIVIDAVNYIDFCFEGPSSPIIFNSLGGLGSSLYPDSATFTEAFDLWAPKAYGRILSISASGSTTIKVNPNTNKNPNCN